MWVPLGIVQIPLCIPVEREGKISTWVETQDYLFCFQSSILVTSWVKTSTTFGLSASLLGVNNVQPALTLSQSSPVAVLSFNCYIDVEDWHGLFD